MRWVFALVLVAGCGSSEEPRPPALQVVGSGGSAVGAGGSAAGSAGTGGSPTVDSGADDTGSNGADAGLDAEPEAHTPFDAGHDAPPKDRCPPGSIGGYPTVPELRAKDVRACYAQTAPGGLWIPWPEDGGSPEYICCRQPITSAWRDDTGCGEIGVLLKDPTQQNQGCVQDGTMLGGAVEAVRCCE